ncbi:MAG: Gfo/Idh/MocA family oxidoreductase [Pseudomonadota bacterium]
MAAASASPLVRMGIAGFGTAGRSFVPAIASHPGFELAAFAEPAPHIRSEIAAELGVSAYASLTEMLSHSGLDAVYIATPTVMHEEHVLQALHAGKHVLVEKPMAVNVAHALSMVDAAKATSRVFVVGHSHGYDMPIQEMRRIIASGSLGRVRMVNTSCYTDWMLRPRRRDELDIALGGGVTYRQGSHQFDIIRILCGGMVRSVRARTFDWNPARPGPGAHMVFLDFEDGAAACAVYNGYGAFSSTDLCFNITESGFEEATRYGPRPVAAADASSEDVIRAKQERAKKANWAKAPFQPVFGLTLVSCERGEIRQSPTGLLVYTDEGMSEINLPCDLSPRDLVLREMHDAIAGKMPALHDAAWGLANLEICDAAIESSASGRDVLLQHQVALRSGR